MLTDSGKILLKYAYEYMNLERELKDAMNILDEPCGTVKISTTETFCSLKIPKLINNFEEIYPKITFHISTHCVNNIVAEVLGRKVDFGIVPVNPKDKDLEFIPIYNEGLVFISHESYWNQLQESGEKSITYIGFGENCVYGSMADRILMNLGFKIKKRMEFSSIETIKGIVGCKLGISLVPYENVKNDIDSGKLKIILDEHRAMLEGGIILRRGYQGSNISKLVMDFFRENIE